MSALPHDPAEPDPSNFEGFHYPHPLTDAHRAELLSKGINLEIAAEEGVRSVEDEADLPNEFSYLAWIVDESNPGAWRKKDATSRDAGEWTFRTGLLYYWHSAFAGPESVPQIKFDVAPWKYDKDSGEPLYKSAWVDGERQAVHETMKYIYPKGQNPDVWVSQRMRARLGQAKYLVIVEGTKQYLTVCSALVDEPDYLVVGVAGCHNWQHGGLPSSALDYVAQGVDQAYVIFDGDCLGDAANENVFKAAKALDAVVPGSTVTGNRCRFVPVPTTGDADPVTGSKDNGIDDFLGQMESTERRANWLVRTMQNKQVSKYLPAKFPGKRKKTPSTEIALPSTSGNAGVPDIDLTREWVKFPDTEHELNGDISVTPGMVVANFAPRIVRTFVVGDLHNYAERRTFYDVEITQSGQTYHVNGIPRTMLDSRDKFAEMLDMAGIAAPKWVNNDLSRSLIAAAMRYDAEQNAIKGEGKVHTGWWDHPEYGAVFLVPDGAVSRDGFRRDVMTFFEKGSERSKIAMGALDDASDNEIREAVRQVNRSFEEWMGPDAEKTAMYLGFGQICLVEASAAAKGMVYFIGQYGSGKSVIQKFFMSFYGKGIGPQMMISNTGKQIAKIGAGLSHITIGLDDVKAQKNDPDRYRTLVNGLYDSIRRAYDGGRAGHASNVKSETASSGWAPGSPDQTDPSFIGTGEMLPPELAEDDPSTIQRLITWHHDSKHLLGGAQMEEMVEAGHFPALANAGYLRQVARWIHDAGGMSMWLNAQEDRDGFDGVDTMRTVLTRKWREHFDGERRNAQVAAGRAIGWRLWTQYCATIGVWDEETAERWSAEGERRILEAAIAHYKTYGLTSGDRGSDLLRDIEGLLMSPQYYLKTSGVEQPSTARIAIGCWHTDRHKKTFMCVHPMMLEHGLRGRKPREIRDALQALVGDGVRIKNGAKSYTRAISWNDGSKTTNKDLYCIPMDKVRALGSGVDADGTITETPGETKGGTNGAAEVA